MYVSKLVWCGPLKAELSFRTVELRRAPSQMEGKRWHWATRWRSDGAQGEMGVRDAAEALATAMGMMLNGWRSADVSNGGLQFAATRRSGLHLAYCLLAGGRDRPRPSCCCCCSCCVVVGMPRSRERTAVPRSGKTANVTSRAAPWTHLLLDAL